LVNAKWMEMHLPRDSEELEKELKKHGVEVDRYVVKGYHLTSVSLIGSKSDDLTPIILRWMIKQLGN